MSLFILSPSSFPLEGKKIQWFAKHKACGHLKLLQACQNFPMHFQMFDHLILISVLCHRGLSVG